MPDLATLRSAIQIATSLNKIQNEECHKLKDKIQDKLSINGCCYLKVSPEYLYLVATPIELLVLLTECNYFSRKPILAAVGVSFGDKLVIGWRSN